MYQKRCYKVKGMHCASCEVLIEKSLVKVPGVMSVDASMKKEQVMIEYSGASLETKNLNQAVAEHGYQIIEESVNLADDEPAPANFWKTILVAGIIITVFYLLYRSGLSSVLSVSNNSALPAFIVFGILAGFSSCAALVGGIILSMSKQWLSLYAPEASNRQKLQPHWMFNIGRLVSYAVFGGLLGAVGGIFKPSLTLTTLLTLTISVFMVILGLQMIGVRSLRNFQFRLPKLLTGRVADETRFKGRYMPLVMGALTFFLPCGFTITAQSLALLSGSAWRGGLIMLFFALGTLPALMAIGYSSVAFTRQKHRAGIFLKAAGIVVLFFALFNINWQLNLLGWWSLSDLSLKSNAAITDKTSQADVAENLPSVIDGKQIVKMDVSASRYSPERLVAQAGIPVRWEITDAGMSGCSSTLVARDFFIGVVQLTQKGTKVIEFTPTKPGTYKFSCGMGMVRGVFDIVEN